jgi:Holliday junction resolvase
MEPTMPRAPKPIEIEADVKDVVKKLLSEFGWEWWMPASNAFGTSGASDFHAVKEGMFLAIETKVKNRKPTPLQKRFLEKVRKAEAFGLLVNEKRLDTLRAWLVAHRDGNFIALNNTTHALSADL